MTDAGVTRNWKYENMSAMQKKMELFNVELYRQETILLFDRGPSIQWTINRKGTRDAADGQGRGGGENENTRLNGCLSPRFSINSSSCLSTILRSQYVFIMKYILFFVFLSVAQNERLLNEKHLQFFRFPHFSPMYTIISLREWRNKTGKFYWSPSWNIDST